MKRTAALVCIILILFASACASKHPADAYRDPAEAVFTVSLESGWGRNHHFILFEDGLLRAYVGDYSLNQCVANASQTLKFSKYLSKEDFENVFGIFYALPPLLEEGETVLDGWYATIRYGEIKERFYLYSQTNTGHAELAQMLIALSVETLHNNP